MSILPSFFVIGAQKAGTTALHDWLETSPEILLPKIKETHYFSDAERYGFGIDWYEKQFGVAVADQKKVIGEIDPDYLFMPDSAEKLQKTIGNPKLIIILREPLSRARSQYMMSIRRGHEKLDFSEALIVEEERCSKGNRFSLENHSYISRGLYSNQIQKWRSTFPLSEMLFVKFDEMINSKSHAESLNNICSFIGIDSTLVRSNVNQKSNQASEPRSTFLRDMIWGESKFKQVLGRLIPSHDAKLRMAMWADKVNLKESKAINPNKHSEILPTFVHQIILEDLGKCSEITKLDLSDWISIHQKAITANLN